MKINFHYQVSILIFVFTLLFFLSCTKKTETPQPPILTKAELVEKGLKVYQMNCISCHGPNPKTDGPIGPSIAGSSLELIAMRVMKTKYPDGYKPKRPTAIMIALPHLEKDIPAIFEYVNSL